MLFLNCVNAQLLVQSSQVFLFRLPRGGDQKRTAPQCIQVHQGGITGPRHDQFCMHQCGLKLNGRQMTDHVDRSTLFTGATGFARQHQVMPLNGK